MIVVICASCSDFVPVPSPTLMVMSLRSFQSRGSTVIHWFGPDTQMLRGKDQIVDFRSSAVPTDLRGRLKLAHDVRWEAGSIRAVFTRQCLHPALSLNSRSGK